MPTPTDAKSQALRRRGALDPRPRDVTDALFRSREFFDPRDLVQVKYEMLRRVHVEGADRRGRGGVRLLPSDVLPGPAAFRRDGLPGLIPRRPGPRRAHKLSDEVVDFALRQLACDPSLRASALAAMIREGFGLVLHPRSIERALARHGKGAVDPAADSGGRSWRADEPWTTRYEDVRRQALEAGGCPTVAVGGSPGGPPWPGGLDGGLACAESTPLPPPHATAPAILASPHITSHQLASLVPILADMILGTRREVHHDAEGHGQPPPAQRLSLRPPVDDAPGVREHREHPAAIRPARTCRGAWIGPSNASSSSTPTLASPAPRAADREGFQRLVAEVGLGRAGIVLGLEVSRLARNSTDWHRLLEICALTDTLILDEDGIYDPGHFNDRLLLGLKGTMCEAELHVLQARFQGGFLNKAARGELKTPLPVGLVYDAQDRVILDPDRQVQQALRPLLRSLPAYRIGLRHGQDVPRAGAVVPAPPDAAGPTRGAGMGAAVHSRALQVLHNPRYAGAFCHGRSRTCKSKDGHDSCRRLPIDEWQA